jgi:hypothetical protein
MIIIIRYIYYYNKNNMGKKKTRYYNYSARSNIVVQIFK